jgi:hypothetical protein
VKDRPDVSHRALAKANLLIVADLIESATENDTEAITTGAQIATAHALLAIEARLGEVVEMMKKDRL